jgi:hypothetical protein
MGIPLGVPLEIPFSKLIKWQYFYAVMFYGVPWHDLELGPTYQLFSKMLINMDSNLV